MTAAPTKTTYPPHPYSSQIRVLFLPMVGFERGFVRDIGADYGRVVFLTCDPPTAALGLVFES